MRKSKSSLLLSLTLVLGLFLPFQGCSSFRPGWVTENSFVSENISEDDITDEDFDGPLNGHFDSDGLWVPDDKTIEWTYKLPDLSGGFIFDIKTRSVTPSLQIELIEFDIPLLPYLATWKIDLGVAHNRTFGFLGPKLTSVFEISAGAFLGWNWAEEEISYGIGFAIIKF